MSDQDALNAAEERFHEISKIIFEVEDVQNRPATRNVIQRHIENTQSAFDDAFLHYDDPESAKRAIDMADMFKLTAQTMGISNMRLVNKDSQRRRADVGEKLARIDTLTQSGNRLAFSEQIKSMIKQQEKEPGIHSAVMLFDLDRFKGLNDTYGHAAGDAGLQAFAEKLKSITRQDNHDDVAHDQRADGQTSPVDSLYTPSTDQAEYRFGGDEFALTMQVRADSAEQAQQMFEAIETRIKDNLSTFSFDFEGKSFPLVSSAGIHILNEGDSAENACEQADIALFEHKTSKSERYAQSVAALENSGADNIAEVPDPRADEKKLLTQAQLGAAVESLQRAGVLDVRVPEGTEHDALAVLKDAGVTVAYSDEDKPEPNTLG